MKNKIIVVAGPTGVGKTKYAIELAKKNGGEIVSLDSVQVYKYLDIGSAKPSKDELSEIKHYMIDEVEPSVNLNVKQFKDLASKYIDKIIEAGKTPILVGGTGFYIRAVLYDTDFMEEDEIESKKIREKLNKELDEKGIDFIFDKLKAIDPESATLIPKENERRVIRAIEFYELHKMPISTHNKIERKKDSKYDFDFYVLNCDREVLYDRINQRVDKMIEDGLLLEVKKLIDMGLSKDLNSMRSIGYSELYDFCKAREAITNISALDSMSKLELDVIIDLIKQHSRNYAKRQLTWFKAQDKIQWINVSKM